MIAYELMNILVTGGAGFIGSHLVDALVEQGDRVRVVDNLQPQVHRGRKPNYLNPKAEYRFQDILDPAVLVQALEGMDSVVHLAALVGVGQSMYEIIRYVEGNCVGTARLLETLTRHKISLKRLVVASSMSIYGEGLYRCAQHGPCSPAMRPMEQLVEHRWEIPCPACGKELKPVPTPEEKPLQPNSVYATSKRDQEELCLNVGQAYGIPTVALRFFNVYGPRQSLANPYTGACAIFSARLKNGKAPVLYEDGQQTRDFIHVSDVVQGIRIALDHPKISGKTLNVGTGRAVSIRQVAETLGKTYRSALTPAIAGRYRAGDIRHCSADITAISAFGFKPRVDLQGGLQDLVRWGESAEAEDLFDKAERELLERRLLAD